MGAMRPESEERGGGEYWVMCNISRQHLERIPFFLFFLLWEGNSKRPVCLFVLFIVLC